MEAYYLERILWVVGMVCWALILAGLTIGTVFVVRAVRRRRSASRLGAGGEDSERGAGTVLVLGIVAVVIVLGLALAAIGAAQQTRGLAQSAADLGALAAATALRHGLDPCDVAQDAVARNRAELGSCTPEGGGVVALTATKSLTGVPAWSGGRADARARAGPRPAG